MYYVVMIAKTSESHNYVYGPFKLIEATREFSKRKEMYGDIYDIVLTINVMA